MALGVNTLMGSIITHCTSYQKPISWWWVWTWRICTPLSPRPGSLGTNLAMAALPSVCLQLHQCICKHKLALDSSHGDASSDVTSTNLFKFDTQLEGPKLSHWWLPAPAAWCTGMKLAELANHKHTPIYLLSPSNASQGTPFQTSNLKFSQEKKKA